MKKLTILFLIVFMSFLVLSYSQSINHIKNSGKYLYGLGESEIYEQADKLALNDLISQISVNVEGTFKITRRDSNFVYNENAESVITTYSSTILNNALRIEEEKRGIYKVVRYMPKVELSEIFQKRERTILEYAKEGIRSEFKFQIADALRNFYWANILLRSHPKYNSLKFFNEGDSLLLNVFLPNKINDIFSNINIEVVVQSYFPKDKYAKYTLGLKYNNEPIQSLDYTFKNKNSWSGTISASGGLACIEYYGDDAKGNKDVSIRIEYMYRDKTFFDKDVQSVFSSDLDLPYFSSCEKITRFKKVKKTKDVGKVSIISINEPDTRVKKNIHDNFKELINSIEQKSTTLNTDFFTPEGLEVYNKLIKYGNAVPLMHDNDLKIVKVNDEIIVRSIPMKFTFSKNRHFIENVVFILNKNEKITDINFSLSQVAINDILSKEERFATQEEKFFLIRFMENYKTAYCLKRIDYLQKVFDEDALIIVGSVLKKRKSFKDSYYTNLSDTVIKFLKLTKVEYINRLNRIFSSNEFINVHFEDNIVEKARNDMSIYGIQIAQHYTSETYADKGYLFLLIDLRDTLNPIIHVRTWQPKKNKDGSIYGLKDFPFDKF